MPATPVPVVDGWFTRDGEPVLLGSRCTTCGAIAFPKISTFCQNPWCAGTEFAEHRLARRGTVWSYTDARYLPPPPYVTTTDPFEPFGILAVELAEDELVVLGQLSSVATMDQIAVGTQVELVIEVLSEDDEHAYQVWRWRPVQESL
jgi:uncharacterized protein